MAATRTLKPLNFVVHAIWDEAYNFSNTINTNFILSVEGFNHYTLNKFSVVGPKFLINSIGSLMNAHVEMDLGRIDDTFPGGILTDDLLDIYFEFGGSEKTNAVILPATRYRVLLYDFNNSLLGQNLPVIYNQTDATLFLLTNQTPPANPSSNKVPIWPVKFRLETRNIAPDTQPHLVAIIDHIFMMIEDTLTFPYASGSLGYYNNPRLKNEYRLIRPSINVAENDTFSKHVDFYSGTSFGGVGNVISLDTICDVSSFMEVYMAVNTKNKQYVATKNYAKALFNFSHSSRFWNMATDVAKEVCDETRAIPISIVIPGAKVFIRDYNDPTITYSNINILTNVDDRRIIEVEFTLNKNTASSSNETIFRHGMTPADFKVFAFWFHRKDIPAPILPPNGWAYPTTEDDFLEHTDYAYVRVDGDSGGPLPSGQVGSETASIYVQNLTGSRNYLYSLYSADPAGYQSSDIELIDNGSTYTLRIKYLLRAEQLRYNFDKLTQPVEFPCYTIRHIIAYRNMVNDGRFFSSYSIITETPEISKQFITQSVNPNPIPIDEPTNPSSITYSAYFIDQLSVIKKERIISTPQERLTAVWKFFPSGYDEIGQGGFPARGVTLLENAIQVDISVYSEFGDIRYFYDQHSISRNANGEWVNSTDESFFGRHVRIKVVYDPNNPDFVPLTLDEKLSFGNRFLLVEYFFRNRYEPNVQSIYAINKNTNNTVNSIQTQDWNGKTIFINCKITIRHPLNSFQDTFSHTLENNVHDYDQECLDVRWKGVSGSDIRFICDEFDPSVKLEANLDANKPECDYQYAAFGIDKSSFNIFNFQEIEKTINVNNLTQWDFYGWQKLNDSPFESSTDFVSSQASANISTTPISKLHEYRGIVIAKRKIAASTGFSTIVGNLNLQAVQESSTMRRIKKPPVLSIPLLTFIQSPTDGNSLISYPNPSMPSQPLPDASVYNPLTGGNENDRSNQNCDQTIIMQSNNQQFFVCKNKNSGSFNSITQTS